jgi:hypothetical protein
MIETPSVDPVTTARPVDVSFKPYMMWRRGMLPHGALASLVPSRTWELLAEIEDAAAPRQELAGRIGDRLYALVPTLAVGDRPGVLRVRRDLHNDRLPPAEAIRAVGAALDAGDRAALDEWRQLREADERRRANAAKMLVAELTEARRQLARVAAGTHFLQGIQLSGTHLYRSVRDYVAEIARGVPARLSKRLRQTEQSIVRYAYRMALRTTPFGAFTDLGAGPWHVQTCAAEACERHLIRLNRGLLGWMVGELRRIEGADRVLQLRLNNTALRTPDHIQVFSRSARDSGDSYLAERVVQVRAVAPVQVLVDALANGPRVKAEVVQRLVDRGVRADQASVLVDRLVEAGLCHQDLALPDQATRVAGAAAARLRTVSTPAADTCAGIFERLQEIEDGFGTAAIDERDRLLASVDEQLDTFGNLTGARMSEELARTFVFEDVSAGRPPLTWRPDLVERQRDRFLQLQQFLPLFDDAVFSRLGMYRWFTARYGEDGRCDDLLTAYRAFAEMSPADVTAVMRGTRDPIATEIRAQRRAVLRRLGDRVAAAGEAPTLDLGDAFVEEIIKALPRAVRPWTEASFRLQIVPGADGEGPLLVVNDASAGHGVFFSRFCDLMETSADGAWSLRRSLRETIAQNGPRQADLAGVFGFNVNLHPDLAPLEIVYPGSVGQSDDALTLRDLALEADPVDRTLRVVNRRDGQPIDLVPLNFLLPLAAPMLYQFLCVLAPLHDWRRGFWDRLRDESRREYAYLPRLTLGGLVLDRRRWSVPSSDVRALGDRSAAETLDTLAAVRRWQDERRIPRECFFRTSRLVDPEPSGDWMAQTRQAFDGSVPRRKGQYLDFRNPLLVRLLADAAQGAGERVVILQECLPPTAVYRGDERASAEEFLIESRLSGRGLS